MKVLAGILILFGMGAIGHEEAKKLTARTRRLTVLIMDAFRIEKEMEWETPTAQTLFQRLHSPVFQCAAEKMQADSTPEEAIGYAAAHLPQEEKEALLDYAAVLRQENPAAQVRGAKMLSERLMRMEEAAREKEKRLGTVYRLTGVLGGLLMVLLLL